MKKVASILAALVFGVIAGQAVAGTKIIVDDGRGHGWSERRDDRDWRRDRRPNGGYVVVRPATKVTIVKPRTTIIYQAPVYRPPVVKYVYKPAPAPVFLKPWSGDWYKWCAVKYRSFNPRTGTYVSYDGQRRFCEAKL